MSGEHTVGSVVGFLKLDAEQYHREIEKAILEADRLSGKKVEVKVKADTRSAETSLGRVAAEADKVDKSATRMGQSFDLLGGGMRSPQVIVGGIAAAMALLGPVTGAATAAMGGFVGVAGTGALAFRGFQQEVQKGTALGQYLQGSIAGIKAEFDALGSTAAHAMEGDVLSGLSQIRRFLPTVNPEVEALAGHLGRAFDTSARGVVAGLQNMMPLLEDGGRYAEILANKFAEFTASNDFKSFVAYAQRELPGVGQAIISLSMGVKDLAVSLAPAGDSLVKIIDATGKVASGFSHVIDAVEWLRNSKLGQLGMAPELDKTAAAATSATSAIDEHTSHLLTLQGAVSPLAAALGTTDSVLNRVRDAQRASAQAARDATASMSNENNAAGLLKQTLDGLNGTNLTAAQAQNAFDSSLANMDDHVTATGKKIHFTTASLSNMSAASVALRGQLNGQVTAAMQTAEAYGQVKKSSEAGREKLVALRKEIIDNAVAHGVDRKAVTAYIDKILQVPKKVPPTKFEVETKPALAAIAAFQKAIDALHGKTVTASVHYAYTGTLPNGGRSTAGGSTFADGGPVSGPGSGTSDSIPAYLSNGEYVMPADKTSKHRGLLDAMRAGKFANGGPVGFASGGPVDAPLSSWFSAYTSSLGSTVSKTDLAADHNRVADAARRLNIAEMKLEQDRRNRHHTALQIARDEAAIAKAREALATATSRQASDRSRYAAQQGSVLSKFQTAVGIGVRDTGAFIKNLERLSARGYGVLAQQLANMGDADAERIAAQAAGASAKTLGSISANIAAGQKQQSIMAHMDAVTAIYGAIGKGPATVQSIAKSSNLSSSEILEALQLISGDLRGNKNARGLLGQLSLDDTTIARLVAAMSRAQLNATISAGSVNATAGRP